MNANTTISSRAFAVPWKELNRWNVDYFHSSLWHWPSNILKRIADFALPEAISISTSEAQEQNIPIISKINFDGHLFLRDNNDYADYKGRLFLVSANRLIFSKINAKRGCIYFHPSNQKLFAVSSEYPVLKLNPTIAYGDYVNLALRIGPAREVLLGSASGMAKPRTSIKDFLNIVIPLPPIAYQMSIVTQWNKTQGNIEVIHEHLNNQKIVMYNKFLADLGLRSNKQTLTPKAFATKWQNFARWGVKQVYLNAQTRIESKYPELRLSELCSIGSGGTPSRKNKDYFGGVVPWVKTAEVRNELITTTEETLTEQGLKNSNAKIYPKGSLVIAMYGQGATRGRTAKLGIDAATNQACLVLYNIDPRIITDFLWYFLISQYDAIRAFASGNNQPNLNASMVANILVPLPPPEIQKQIVAHMANELNKIIHEREAAEELSKNIKTEVEAMILGTKTIAEN